MRLQRPEKNSPHAQHGLQRREKGSAGRDEIQGFISRLRFLLKHRLSDSNYRNEVLSITMECTLIFVFSPFLSSWLLVCICYAENFGRNKTGLTISSSQDSFQETSSPLFISAFFSLIPPPSSPPSWLQLVDVVKLSMFYRATWPFLCNILLSVTSNYERIIH